MDESECVNQEHVLYYIEKCCFPTLCTASDILIELSCKYEDKYCAVSLINYPYLFFSRASYEMFDVPTAKRFVEKLPKWVEILDLSDNNFPPEIIRCFLPLLQRENFKFLNLTVNNKECLLSDDPRQVLKECFLSDEEDKLLDKVIWMPKKRVEVQVGPLAKRHSDFYSLFTHHASEFYINDEGEDYD